MTGLLGAIASAAGARLAGARGPRPQPRLLPAEEPKRCAHRGHRVCEACGCCPCCQACDCYGCSLTTCSCPDIPTEPWT